MAVIVIDSKPHPSVVKEKICRNCGATLQYTPQDVATKKDYDYTGSFDVVRYIKCPQCSKDVNV